MREPIWFDVVGNSDLAPKKLKALFLTILF